MNKISYKPPDDWLKIKTIEMHTAGEPLRILLDGLPEIKGNTILEMRDFFRKNLDFIRTGTIFEPRGHADMYGAVICNPTSPGSDFGTFFLHNEGYSTMCGHAIIALTKFAIESGMIDYQTGQEIIIDVPSGQVKARAIVKNSIVTKSVFQNVPSFVYMTDVAVNVPQIGIVKADIAYGGAFYAICDAEKLGLKLDRSNYLKIIDYGKRIKKALNQSIEITHPFEKELGVLYGTIFTAKAKNKKHHSRNVCIFADGELDRSPTGSGVSARAALHYTRNELRINEKITIESILGSTMDVKVTESLQYAKYPAIIPEVSGKAHFTGKNEFWFDPKDPYSKGFILR